MYTDALVTDAPIKRKDCNYCSQKINPNEEQYHEGKVYHEKCRQEVMLRKKNPDVFKEVVDIRQGLELLFETSPQWKVQNSMRIRLIHKAIKFLLPTKSHNQLNQGGMASLGVG